MYTIRCVHWTMFKRFSGSMLLLCPNDGFYRMCNTCSKQRHWYLQYRKTPLHLAAENGHLAVVTLLLDHAAHVDAKAVVRLWTSFLECDCWWNVAMRHICLDANFYYSLIKTLDTPFHKASEFGHLAVVTLLLDRAVGVNAVNSVSIDAWLQASTPLGP